MQITGVTLYGKSENGAELRQAVVDNAGGLRVSVVPPVPPVPVLGKVEVTTVRDSAGGSSDNVVASVPVRVKKVVLTVTNTQAQLAGLVEAQTVRVTLRGANGVVALDARAIELEMSAAVALGAWQFVWDGDLVLTGDDNSSSEMGMDMSAVTQGDGALSVWWEPV